MCVAKGGVYGKCGGLTKMEVLKRFLRDEGGLETVEWAFVLGFAILGAVLVAESAAYR